MSAPICSHFICYQCWYFSCSSSPVLCSVLLRMLFCQGHNNCHSIFRGTWKKGLVLKRNNYGQNFTFKKVLEVSFFRIFLSIPKFVLCSFPNHLLTIFCYFTCSFRELYHSSLQSSKTFLYLRFYQCFNRIISSLPRF